MSLGGGFSSGLDAAVKNAADQGIQFAIAAGNSGDDADYYSPAAAGDHANVYTVSAVDNRYQMSSWSNWDDSSGGDDVDVAAPGVSVLSYYQGGGLAYLSGTSMAAPHVAGALLMGGVVEGDEVSVFYDPMIAKLVVWGENREIALKRLISALGDYYIDGVSTNIDFLKRVATHPACSDTL